MSVLSYICISKKIIFTKKCHFHIISPQKVVLGDSQKSGTIQILLFDTFWACYETVSVGNLAHYTTSSSHLNFQSSKYKNKILVIEVMPFFKLIFVAALVLGGVSLQQVMVSGATECNKTFMMPSTFSSKMRSPRSSISPLWVFILSSLPNYYLLRMAG